MTEILYWAAAVLLFGIVITVHELGHFWVARMTGIGVVEFAVGMGPKLFSHQSKKSGTVYSLRIFPFGGYCRFVGEEEEEMQAYGKPYFQEKIWKRALSSFGGPFMNVLLSFLLVLGIYTLIGVYDGTSLKVKNVSTGSPAEIAGIIKGDTIVSIDEKATINTEEAAAAIQKTEGKKTKLVVNRNGKDVPLMVTPLRQEDGVYLIGIAYAPVPVGFAEGLEYTVYTIGDMCATIFKFLRDAIFRGEGTTNMAGPIGTVVSVKENTQAGGLSTYFSLTAFISVNLGLFNLLPVPGLDGSKLLLLLVEKIRGKRMDPNKEGIITLIGFGFMVLLMLVVLYQDIARLLSS